MKEPTIVALPTKIEGAMNTAAVGR